MEEHQDARKTKRLQMLQEDENRSPREPNNTLQVMILQENSMAKSLRKQLLGNFGKVGLKALKQTFKDTNV